MFYHYIPLLYTINNKFPTLDANACHARGRIFPRSQNGIAEKLKAADSKRYLCKLQRRSHWHKKRNNRSRNARVRVENRVVRFLWLPVYVIYPPPFVYHVSHAYFDIVLHDVTRRLSEARKNRRAAVGRRRFGRDLMLTA